MEQHEVTLAGLVLWYSQGKQYMSVVTDRFQGWVEATPVSPQFGIPSEISSDNRSAFVQKIAEGTLQQLRTKQRLRTVYHHQSQSLVERINETFKAKPNEICASTNLSWVEALPLALVSYSMQTHTSTHKT